MDPNPYAPPTATVADVENPAASRRMPLGVRLLQLFCALSLYSVLGGAWRAASYLLAPSDGGAAVVRVWFVLAWQLAITAFTVAVIVALQRRAKHARALAQAYCGYMICATAFVTLTEPAGQANYGAALVFAALLGWLWYGSSWSRKAKAFYQR